MSEYWPWVLVSVCNNTFLRYLNARIIEDKANAFKLQANMTLRDLNVFLDVLDETLQADPVLLKKLEDDLAAGRLRI